MRREIEEIFAASIAAQRSFLEANEAILERVVCLLAERLRAGNKILLFGNGGSAADAQHIAAEFVNRFRVDRPPLPAIALTTDTSALTSIANDRGYAEVFARQISALGRAGDVAVAISTSGMSPNVLRGVEECRRLGIHTVGLTGGDGGALGTRVDHHLCVRGVTDTARIQEVHIVVGHAFCELVERVLRDEVRPRNGGDTERRRQTATRTAGDSR